MNDVRTAYFNASAKEPMSIKLLWADVETKPGEVSDFIVGLRGTWIAASSRHCVERQDIRGVAASHRHPRWREAGGERETGQSSRSKMRARVWRDWALTSQ